ncbi:MAG: hypothetical protein ACK5LL_16440 [Suipraeoptans sp.]
MDKGRGVVERISRDVLGPGLCGFTLWVLKEAQKNKIKRLYFLARDGYLMYQSAKIFCNKFDLQIECRYLSCSRYALRIPMFHLNIDEAMEYICRGGISVNMEKILRRAGLGEDEIKEVITSINQDKDKSNMINLKEEIPYSKLGSIKELLASTKVFMSYMIKNSEKEFPNLRGYLIQEGLLEDIPSAMIDSGWVGTTQKVINNALYHIGGTQRLTGYYWGLYELPKGVRRSDYHCYYFSPEADIKEKVYFNNCLFEVIFSAPHGMTLRYRKNHEEYSPQYAVISKARKTFAKEHELCIMQYLRETLSKVSNLEDFNHKISIKNTKLNFKKFMGSPCGEEALVYGNCMFSDDVLENEMQKVAAPMTDDELNANHVFNKTLAMFGIKKGIVKESAWYEASAVIYGKNMRWHLWQYRMYKYLLYMRKTWSWRRSNE